MTLTQDDTLEDLDFAPDVACESKNRIHGEFRPEPHSADEWVFLSCGCVIPVCDFAINTYRELHAAGQIIWCCDEPATIVHTERITR